MLMLDSRPTIGSVQTPMLGSRRAFKPSLELGHPLVVAIRPAQELRCRTPDQHVRELVVCRRLHQSPEHAIDPRHQRGVFPNDLCTEPFQLGADLMLELGIPQRFDSPNSCRVERPHHRPSRAPAV
jgi:hypothetical protein